MLVVRIIVQESTSVNETLLDMFQSRPGADLGLELRQGGRGRRPHGEFSREFRGWWDCRAVVVVVVVVGGDTLTDGLDGNRPWFFLLLWLLWWVVVPAAV